MNREGTWSGGAFLYLGAGGSEAGHGQMMLRDYGWNVAACAYRSICWAWLLSFLQRLRTGP